MLLHGTDRGNPLAEIRRFADDEAGTQAIEVLLIFVSILVPCFAAILLLQDVLIEYLEVTTILVTSPFF